MGEKLRSILSHRRTLLLIVIIISLLIGFINLGSPSLERWDEVTNAKVVHSIVNEGKFELDGNVFTEKPPLCYYMTAIIVKIFGENNLTLRAVSALSFVFISILIFIICEKRYSKRLAFIAALSIAGVRQFMGIGLHIFSTHSSRSADLDTLQILFMLLSFFILSEGKKHKVFLTALFSALAVLTKGPLGLLIPILYLAFTMIKKKDISEAVKIIIITILIVLPWHIAMSIYYPDEFLVSYINYHIFSRTLMPIENHSGSTLFYLELILNPFIFFGGIILLNTRKVFKDLTKDIFEFILILFPLSIIVLFTIVQTKLAWYLLPIYPFLIFLISKIIYEKKLFFNIFTNIFYTLFSFFILKSPFEILIIL